MKRKIDFDILESLRGLASLYVCIGHARALLWIGGEHYLKLHPRETLAWTDYLLLGMNMLTRLSTEFVIVFFVLSGFSIAHSLRNSKAPGAFYKRRFVRLYPPYLLALLWATLTIGLLQWIVPQMTNGTFATPAFQRLADSRQLFDGAVIAKNLVYLPQLDGILRPFWSLTQEVIFYLIAPFVFRNTRLYYIGSLALFLFSVANSSLQLLPDGIIMSFFRFNLFFALGAFLYHHFDRIQARLKFFTSRYALHFALILFVGMIGISLKNQETLNALVAAVFSVTLIIYLLHHNTRINWLIGVGRFSYTLYITHFPTIFLYMAGYFLVTGTAMPYIFNPFAFIPAIFLCLGVAYLQYLLVEKRSKNILDRLRSKASRPVGKAVAEQAAG